MEVLTLAILKAVATTCIKLYLGSLLGGGAISAKSSELGYKIPKWYMNPGRAGKTFYAYGTSVRGDEFESIDDARQRALEQMVNHIRLSNQKIIGDQIRFDKTSVKQQRLVELFIRGDGLEDFIRMNAALDKKQLVRVEEPETDMRAFVRLALPADAYIAYQEATVKDLKQKIVRQKSDDILAEIEQESQGLINTQKVPDTPIEGAVPATPKAEPRPQTSSKLPSADNAFDELEAEQK